MTAPAVEVRTTLYEFAHGKKPRGEGQWAFKIGYRTFWSQGTYAQAKRAAQAEAASQGVGLVWVMS
jgi:hypothetical protein